MPSGDQKISKIQNHFQHLSAEAKLLNEASDELTKVVGALDDALKKLNVGLTVWVLIVKWTDEIDISPSPNMTVSPVTRYCSDQIGYCKINGKWGVALRRVAGDDISGDDDIEGPWLFNDAPRELRLSGVDKIPELMEKLGDEASKTALRIREKTHNVRELADAIGKIANEPKPSKAQIFLDRMGAEAVKAAKANMTLRDMNPPKDGGK